MTCPICTGSKLPEDVSIVDKYGRRVLLQGKIYAIINPEDTHYPPFADYFTVSLYPRKGKVKCLKFSTKEELDKWELIPDTRIKCEGCLHKANGKEIVFDIINIEFL